MRVAVLLLCLLSSSAFALPQGPFSGANPSGTEMAEVLAKLPIPRETKIKIMAAIGKVWGHPAMMRLKENLTKEQIECKTAEWAHAVLLAMIESAVSDVGKAKVAGAEEALKRIWDADEDWCDGRGGQEGADAITKTMRANGIKIQVPPMDDVASAKAVKKERLSMEVPHEPAAIRGLRAIMALGLLVGEGTGATLSPANLIPAFVITPTAAKRLRRNEDDGT